VREDIASLYVALFQRAPEKEGLDYWYKKAIRENLTLTDVANEMIESAKNIAKDYSNIYPYYVDLDYSYEKVEKFVEEIYKILLNKDLLVDKEGIDYWSNEIIKSKDFGSVVVSLINSIKDPTTDEDRLKAQKTFYNRIKLSTYTSDRFKSADIDGDGKYEFEFFQDIVKKVSDTQESLINAQKIVDSKTFKDITTLSYQELPQDVKSLIDGGKKLDSALDGVVTYSFNETIPPEYYSLGIDLSSFTPFNKREREIVKEAFDSLEKHINLKFVEVESEGDIRFSNIDLNFEEGGVTWMVNDDKNYLAQGSGADIFINNIDKKDNIYTLKNVIYHEIGHALGLKHPFEGDVLIPADENNTLYTIMSYTNYKDGILYIKPLLNSVEYGVDIGGRDEYGILDIKALGWMYGLRDKSADDFYDFSSLGEYKHFDIVVDNGGVDTISVENESRNSTIDLSPKFSTINFYSLEDQLKDKLAGLENSEYYFVNIYPYLKSNEDLIYTREDNLSIYGEIENVIAGSGNDVIKDNYLSNKIVTNGGDDKIYISGGDDFVDGGEGEDIIILNKKSDEVEIIDNYILYDDGVIEYVNVEGVQLLDQFVNL